jgi:hypothetical protein
MGQEAKDPNDDLDDAPDTTAPAAPAAHAPAAARPAASAVYSVPVISKMQQSLVNLATLVSNELTPKEIAGPKGQQSALGRTTFGNFIVQHYLRPSPVKPTEFDSAHKPTKMSNIMETMSRLGSSKNDFAIDGRWGPKTNAALRDSNAFAFAMLKLAADFELPVKAYSSAILAEFKIPENDTDWSIPQKTAAAPAFIKHIDAIANLFREIKDGLLNHPEHKSYIEGNQPFMSYKKVEPLTPEEQSIGELLAKGQPLPINEISFSLPQPGGRGELSANINYRDLLDIQNFDNWYVGDAAKNLKQPGVTMSAILSAIRKALESKLAAANPPAVAPQAAAPVAPGAK